MTTEEYKRIIENEDVLDNRPDDKETNHYIIDLDTDAIFEIVSMFGDLEVESLGLLNYEPTVAAASYARMLDKWNNLLSYR